MLNKLIYLCATLFFISCSFAYSATDSNKECADTIRELIRSLPVANRESCCIKFVFVPESESCVFLQKYLNEHQRLSSEKNNSSQTASLDLIQDALHSIFGIYRSYSMGWPSDK